MPLLVLQTCYIPLQPPVSKLKQAIFFFNVPMHMHGSGVLMKGGIIDFEVLILLEKYTGKWLGFWVVFLNVNFHCYS